MLFSARIMCKTNRPCINNNNQEREESKDSEGGGERDVETNYKEKGRRENYRQ